MMHVLLFSLLASIVSAQSSAAEQPVPILSDDPQGQHPGAYDPDTCQQGEGITTVLLPYLEADLAKWIQLGWREYSYSFFFVRQATVYCPLEITVKNDAVTRLQALETDNTLPDGTPCQQPNEQLKATIRLLTVTTYIQELIDRAPNSQYMCWAPATSNGALVAYTFHGAGAAPSAGDTEVFLLDLRPLGPGAAQQAADAAKLVPQAPGETETVAQETTVVQATGAPTPSGVAAEAQQPVSGNGKKGNLRRTGAVWGAAVGAVEGCVAGAIFAGRCGRGAAAGATIGAINGAMHGPRWGPYGPGPYYRRGGW